MKISIKTPEALRVSLMSLNPGDLCLYLGQVCVVGSPHLWIDRSGNYTRLTQLSDGAEIGVTRGLRVIPLIQEEPLRVRHYEGGEY